MLVHVDRALAAPENVSACVHGSRYWQGGMRMGHGCRNVTVVCSGGGKQWVAKDSRLMTGSMLWAIHSIPSRSSRE